MKKKIKGLSIKQQLLYHFENKKKTKSFLGSTEKFEMCRLQQIVF